MIRGYTVVESKFVRDANNTIIGIKPVYVEQKMDYRNGVVASFSYDTKTSSEADVDRELSCFDPFVANLFNISVSLSSRQIWRKGGYIPFDAL